MRNVQAVLVRCCSHKQRSTLLNKDEQLTRVCILSSYLGRTGESLFVLRTGRSLGHVRSSEPQRESSYRADHVYIRFELLLRGTIVVTGTMQFLLHILCVCSIRTPWSCKGCDYCNHHRSYDYYSSTPNSERPKVGTIGSIIREVANSSQGVAEREASRLSTHGCPLDCCLIDETREERCRRLRSHRTRS